MDHEEFDFKLLIQVWEWIVRGEMIVPKSLSTLLLSWAASSSSRNVDTDKHKCKRTFKKWTLFNTVGSSIVRSYCSFLMLIKINSLDIPAAMKIFA